MLFGAICVCVNTNPMSRHHLQLSTAPNIDISTDRASSIFPDTDSSRKRLDTCRRSSIVRKLLPPCIPKARNSYGGLSESETLPQSGHFARSAASSQEVNRGP